MHTESVWDISCQVKVPPHNKLEDRMAHVVAPTLRGAIDAYEAEIAPTWVFGYYYVIRHAECLVNP